MDRTPRYSRQPAAHPCQECTVSRQRGHLDLEPVLEGSWVESPASRSTNLKEYDKYSVCLYLSCTPRCHARPITEPPLASLFAALTRNATRRADPNQTYPAECNRPTSPRNR